MSLFSRFVLLVSLLAFPMAVFAAFPDVSAGSEHATAIQSLVDQKVLEGYSDGSFQPNKTVNRAEALKIILMGTGANTSGSGGKFSDVASGAWYEGYVGAAVEAGIVQGYSDGTFKPEDTVNRAEALKILLVAAGLSGSIQALSEDLYEDVTADAWYGGMANYAVEFNVVPPQADGLWHPGDELSRADLAEMVYRWQQIKSTGKAYDASGTWPRYSFPTASVSLKAPFGWFVKQSGVAAIWWHDFGNEQMSLLTPYENGATLLMVRYSNSTGRTSQDLFDSLKEHSGYGTNQSKINGYPSLVIFNEDGLSLREWYLYLPDKTLLHLQALVGDGAYSPYLEDRLEEIVSSVEYEETASNGSMEDAVATLRAAIQVDGQGSAAKGVLSDWELIETDAIGVGTGPVDYFYSPSANITIKYERSFDVILDLKEGRSSAF
jgi:hypothetical protein